MVAFTSRSIKPQSSEVLQSGQRLKKGEEEEEVKAEESQSQRPLREMISELFEHLKTQSLKSLLHKKGKEERKGCRDKKKDRKYEFIHGK